MKQPERSITAAAFTGQWIGETQGCEMPAHLWEITQHGTYLSLRTRWEGENTFAHFGGMMISGEAAFTISTDRLYKAILIDKQHFVIPGWCTGTKEGWDGESMTYDVVFSRPGIGELTARTAYLKSLGQRNEETNSQAVRLHQKEIDPKNDHPV